MYVLQSTHLGSCRYPTRACIPLTSLLCLLKAEEGMGTYLDLHCHIKRQIMCNHRSIPQCLTKTGDFMTQSDCDSFQVSYKRLGFLAGEVFGGLSRSSACYTYALPILGLRVYIQQCSSRELPVHGWGRDPADSPCLGHLCTRLMQCIPLSWAESRAGAEKHLFSPGAERTSVSRQHLHIARLLGSGGFLEPFTVLQKYLPSPV